MERTTKPATTGLIAGPGLVSRALRDAADHPGLLLGLYAVNLLATAGAWMLMVHALGPALEGRPEPDLFRWAVIYRTDLSLTVDLLLAAFMVAAVYMLTSVLVTGAALERLAGGSAAAGAWRHLGRLLALRVTLGLPVVGLIALWLLTARWLWPMSLEMVDDRGPALVQAAAGLVFAAPAIWLLMTLHYAQAMAAAGQKTFRALAGAVRLIWRTPLLCLAAWSCCWLAWVAVTLVFGLAQVEHPLVAQIAVALRVFIHIWSLAVARRVVTEVGVG